MINQEFNVNDVQCSGFLMMANERINQDNYMILKTFVNMHLMYAPAKTILQELHDSEMVDNHIFAGVRVNDNQGLLDRMITGLISYAENVVGKALASSWIDAQINKMTANEMIHVLEKAIIDAACSDYHFEYEEVYD
jgi:nitrogenase subunit NifH